MSPLSFTVVEMKKKKRRRGEGMSLSLPAPGAHEPKYRRRRVHRQESHEPGTYSLLL
jgi:hypothetical protein